METGRATRYGIGDLIVDTGRRCVTRAGIDLQVTGLSFELLLVLGSAAPNLVAADVLLDTLWRGQMVGPEVLTQRVRLLRRQLGDEGAEPRYIASRRGHGYRLLTAMQVLPDARSTGNPETQMLYEQARAMIRGTHASRDDALRFLDIALQKQPDFTAARAYRALLVAGSVPLSGEPRSRLAIAERDALQSLDREPDLVDAHLARGIIAADRHDWPQSDAHFRVALAAQPGHPFAVNLHALFLLRPTGRLREALAAHLACHQLAPADGFTLHELVLTYSLLGEDSEALRCWQLSQTLSGVAEAPWDVKLALARASARAGDAAAATAMACSALPAALCGSGAGSAIRLAHAAPADPAEIPAAVAALAALHPVLGTDGVDRRTRAYFISLLAGLGAVDAAYALLEQLLFADVEGMRSVELADLWLPEMQRLRADDRFVPLLRRLGLPEVQTP